jgi:hypothetical protein
VEISKEEALDRTDGICAFPPETPQEESMEIKRSFWQQVFGVITNAWHDLFGADSAQACEETILYRPLSRNSGTLEIIDPNSVSLVVHTPPLSKSPFSILNLTFTQIFVSGALAFLTEVKNSMKVRVTSIREKPIESISIP